MKKTIKLTESNLHRIVKESLKRVLNENFYQKRDDYLDALEDNKYYSDEFRREMLQLSDKHVLWDINNENFDFDEYCIECDYALKKLSEKYGTKFYLLGRSGRHVCVEDTKENRKRFYKMQKDVEEMQNEIISKFSNVNENSKLRRIVKESVKKMLNEAEAGSISHGTMRNEDVLPRIMSALFKEDKAKAREIWKNNPGFLEALCDKECGIDNPWWESEEATSICEELFDVMNEYAPDGHYFGAHPGDGSDYGYWPNEE